MYTALYLALVLLTCKSPAHAFWRLPCGIVQVGRVDPIVSPGKLGGHAHKIAGANNVDVNSNYDSLRQSSCTSCAVGADRSAYWTPILYYRHANGTYEEVPNDGITIYYEGRGDDRTDIKPFPPGLRMVSGDTTLRSYDQNTTLPLSDRPQADRVSFACLDWEPTKEQPYLWNTQCMYGMRAQVHFQSCWDGLNLYKQDQSHVAYMSGLDNGKCPLTHPVKLMHMFYETMYSVNNVAKHEGGKFVFSNGDTTGYGFHGDFMNGWDQDVLAAAVKECANTDSGQLEDCAPFAPTLNATDFAHNCPEKPGEDTEPVHGFIQQLPGCTTVIGPDGIHEAVCSCDSHPLNSTTPIQNTTFPGIEVTPPRLSRHFKQHRRSYRNS